MKVLILSHTVFSKTESMGKTLSAYFEKFDNSELAQFYIHSQVPNSYICYDYYRITDKDAIKSILKKECGKVFNKNNINPDKIDARTDIGLTAKIYQKARKRTPLIYFLRNIWWKLSHWNNKNLKKWLDDINPDCIFFAAGDYAFMYDIARKISQERKIPLYVCCMDDFYFYNSNSKRFLGRIQHRMFMKTVNKTISNAREIFCICDKMSKDYSKLFNKKCVTIHTPTTLKSIKIIPEENKSKKISYLGTLGYNRDKQLIAIGRAIKKMNLEIKYIDVYSTEMRQEILSQMTEENGIKFHGAIGEKEVLDIIKNSLAVIHVESFDDISRNSVKYSVSTKIADSLASGTCIFAYGPSEIASIQYLMNNDAAICCVDENQLSKDLNNLILNSSLRHKVIANAINLAKENHTLGRTPVIIRNEIERTL